MADTDTAHMPWYASDKMLAAIFLAAFADLAWFLISGWLHEREHAHG